MSGGAGVSEAAPPAQVVARVGANLEAGEYRHLVLDTGPAAAAGVPGQFAALAVGGEPSGLLLRRSFSVHRSTAEDGTLELVVAAHGPGTRWIAALRVGDTVDVVAPLGRGFPLAEPGSACVVVGGGYGSAPLAWLAQALRERGCRVDAVLGAATRDRLFGVAGVRELAGEVAVTTEDGSEGTRGRVTDVLPGLVRASGARTVYACGPMGMLRAVSAQAAELGALAQCAVEESMACGIGVCMTCVLPVVGDDGATRMVRSCVEGPVLRGDRVRWDAWTGRGSSVPADAVGAPR